MVRKLLFHAFVGSFLMTLAFAQCGVPGVAGVPRIAVEGDVIGRPSTFVVEDGAPNSDWVGLVDVVAGPTPTSIGLLCVGPNPALVFDSVAGNVLPLDAFGEVRVPLPLPVALAPFEGTPFHYQVLVRDFAVPSGVSISEDLTVSFARPRVFVGTQTPAGDGIVSIDPSTGAIDFQVTFASFTRISKMVLAKKARLLAVRTSASEVIILDSDTGTSSSIMLANGIVAADIALSRDGEALLVVGPVNPANPNGPIQLTRLDLTTGNGVTWPAPSIVSVRDVVVPEDGAAIYLPSGDGSVGRMNPLTGAVLPPLTTASFQPFAGLPATSGYTWTIDGSTLWLAAAGWPLASTVPPVVTRIDLLSGTVAGSMALGMADYPAGDIVIAANGPMATNPGPAMFVQTGTGIKELDPTTLVQRRSIPTAGTLARSPAGTELVITQSASLLRLNLATGFVQFVAAIPQLRSRAALTPEGGYLFAGGDLLAFATDPVGLPSSVGTVSSWTQPLAEPAVLLAE